jgi:acetate kinase
MQAISTVPSSLANLGLPLETHDWQRLIHALLDMFKSGEVRGEVVTSVIWSGAVWGRLEDPSTLDVIKAIRTRAEQSTRLAVFDAKLHQALAQVR